MALCTNCGANIDDGALFCTECGKPLPQSEASTSEVATTATAHAETIQTPATVQMQTAAVSFEVPVSQEPERFQQVTLSKKTFGIIIGVIVSLVIAVIIAVAMINSGSNEEPAQSEQTQDVVSTTAAPKEEPQSNPSADTNGSTASSDTDAGEATGTKGYAVTTSGSNSTYTNTKHGYKITVPSNYVVSIDSVGAAMTFRDEANDMTIRLDCFNNSGHLDIESCYQDLAAGHDVAYRFVGKETCVASYAEGTRVFYMKDYVGSGSILSVSFEYPQDNSSTCDQLLEQIIETIEPGNLTVAHDG